MQLRPVRKSDCRLLWTWVNDPETRTWSFSGERISWKSHIAWFKRVLESDDCELFIAEDEGPIGQVRLDSRGDGWDVTVSVAPQLRGRGYGTQMIMLTASLRDDVLHAYIKSANEGSVRAFEKAGFSRLGEDDGVLHYVLVPSAKTYECRSPGAQSTAARTDGVSEQTGTEAVLKKEVP